MPAEHGRVDLEVVEHAAEISAQGRNVEKSSIDGQTAPAVATIMDVDHPVGAGEMGLQVAPREPVTPDPIAKNDRRSVTSDPEKEPRSVRCLGEALRIIAHGD